MVPMHMVMVLELKLGLGLVSVFGLERVKRVGMVKSGCCCRCCRYPSLSASLEI
jgi:hypothetical protein